MKKLLGYGLIAAPFVVMALLVGTKAFLIATGLSLLTFVIIGLGVALIMGAL